MSRHLARGFALAAAEEYWGLGFPVLPVHPKAKKPSVKGWSRSRPLPVAALEKWFGPGKDFNVGLCMGGGYVAIDVDLGSGGLDTWREWVKDQELPPTAEARSGGDGFHFIFRLPPGIQVGCPKSPGRGIDIKGAGGFIVVEPSIHPVTGKQYVWIRHPKEGIAACPEWLLAKLLKSSEGRAPTRKAAKSPPMSVALPLSGDVPHWVAWAIERHPITERKTRWQTSVRLVPAVFGRVRDLDITIAIMRGWWEYFHAAGLCETDPDPGVVEAEVLPYLKKLVADPSFRSSASDAQHRAGKSRVGLVPEVYRRMGLRLGHEQDKDDAAERAGGGGDVMRVTRRPATWVVEARGNHLCRTDHEAAYVEALAVHAHHQRTVDRALVLKMTNDQVRDIVAERHPDIGRWDNKQMERLAAKFIERPDVHKPARRLALLRRTYCGHNAIGGQPARASEYEITGLEPFLALGTTERAAVFAAAG